MASSSSPQTSPILFFDGTCNLCNGFVDFLIRRDTSERLRFASLQGETARSFLSERDTKAMPSVVLWIEGESYRESDAALKTLSLLGGAWRLAFVLHAIPRPLRDGIYRFVARNRYRWFGKRETCRIPSPSEKSRFLN